MKLIVFSDGSANQIALLKKISELTEIRAWVLYSRKDTQDKSNLMQRSKKLLLNLCIFSVENTWIKLQRRYLDQLKEFEISPAIKVANVNDEEVYKLIKREQPNLVLVSGTNLLKKHLIDEIKKSGKIINLHTGLSPYINGGPNCTNWCLYSGKFHYVGTTVMYINEGIDSGDIIASEHIQLMTTRNPLQLHLQLMEKSHELVCEVLKILLRGDVCLGINQSHVGVDGRTYFSKEWNFWKSIVAYFNFYRLRYLTRPSTRESKNLPLTFTPTIERG
jgi:folate-dependent phosphoribosylglycinamide formyltransferase PurN